MRVVEVRTACFSWKSLKYWNVHNPPIWTYNCIKKKFEVLMKHLYLQVHIFHRIGHYFGQTRWLIFMCPVRFFFEFCVVLAFGRRFYRSESNFCRFWVHLGDLSYFLAFFGHCPAYIQFNLVINLLFWSWRRKNDTIDDFNLVKTSSLVGENFPLNYTGCKSFVLIYVMCILPLGQLRWPSLNLIQLKVYFSC